MNIKNDVVILRVDPNKRTIASMKIRIGKNAVPEVKRLCRAKAVGWRELQDVDGDVLVVAGGLEVDEAMKGWRLKGGEDTAGIGVLFGKGPGGGMVDSPVDIDWLRSRIVWLEGEDVVERAAEILPTLNDEIRGVMHSAIPTPNGDMWLPVEHQAQFDALLALGLTTPSTKGQRLSPLGVSVHDLLAAEAG